MNKSINHKIQDVHLATEDEIMLLPTIEAEADKIFRQIGINSLPPAASVEELLRAKAILVHGHPPTGFARLEELDGNAHLEQLSVSPDHAGQGIGGKLLEQACQWASQQGYLAITLSTYKDVKWNAPFYGKHGFKAIEDLSPGLQLLRDHEIELGLDQYGPRVVMKRILDKL